MFQNVDPDLLKWVIVAIVVVLAVALAAPLLTLVSYARTRKEDLERAFNSQPAGAQDAAIAAAIRLDQASITLVNSARLARDITDRDPNTPQYAPYTGDPVTDAISGMQVLAHFPHRALTNEEQVLVLQYSDMIVKNYTPVMANPNAPSG